MRPYYKVLLKPLMIHKHYQFCVKLLFPEQKIVRPRVCNFRYFYVVINIIINLIINLII